MRPSAVSHQSTHPDPPCPEYFSGGLGGDKTLQEPFLHAHLTAALAAGEGEIHVVAVDGVGPVGVALWYA